MLLKTGQKGITMFKASPNNNSFPYFNKKHLIAAKTKAIHSGIWFKKLQRIDRALFDLTIRVVDNIRSSHLARSVLVLTRKLENGLKGSFSTRLREIGLLLVQKISSGAQKSGTASAVGWVFDSSFAIFLALINLNNVKISRRKYGLKLIGIQLNNLKLMVNVKFLISIN